jgi:gluconate 2-dehydrogenase gamma chain
MSYYRGDQEMYRSGIAALNSTCLALHKKRFESLDFSEQEALLKQLQKGKIDKKTWGDVPQIKFFNTLVSHTMQGFYGSPVHGGNKDYMSFTMLDFEYPLVIGQNRYLGKKS